MRRASVIVVIEDGRIVQRGSHDELLAEGGTYRRLYTMQFADEDEAATDPALT